MNFAIIALVAATAVGSANAELRGTQHELVSTVDADLLHAAELIQTDAQLEGTDRYFKKSMNAKETLLFWDTLKEFAKLMDARGAVWTLAYGACAANSSNVSVFQMFCIDLLCRSYFSHTRYTSSCMRAGTMVGAHCLGNMLPWDDEIDVFVIGRKSWGILNDIQSELQDKDGDYRFANDNRKIYQGEDWIKKFFNMGGRKHHGRGNAWRSPFLDIAKLDCGVNDADTMCHAHRLDKHPYYKRNLLPVSYAQFGPVVAPIPGRTGKMIKDRYGVEPCTKCGFNSWNHMDEKRIHKCTTLELAAEAPDCYVDSKFKWIGGVPCDEVTSCPGNVMDGKKCCIQRVVTELPDVTQAERDAFLQQAGIAHAKELNQQICAQLKSIEMYNDPKSIQNDRVDFNIVFWNAERGTHWNEALEQLRDADIILLNEVDSGMARSGNVNVARSLAKALNMNYVQGIEFVELTNGIESEIKATEGMQNTQGFHNNAILSRYPLISPYVQRMPSTDRWFGRHFGYGSHSEVRLGGRMALYVKTIINSKPLWLIVTHLDGTSEENEAIANKVALDAHRDAPMLIVGDMYRPRLRALQQVGFDFSINNKNKQTPTYGYRHNVGTGRVEAHGHDHTHLFGIRGFSSASDVEISPPEGRNGELLSDSAFIHFNGRL